jgi:hypothetical protein
VDDVAVTLEKVSTGHDQNSSIRADRNGHASHEFGTNRVDGQNSTFCFIRLQPLTNTNQVWCVAGEEVSDATGNKARNTSFGSGSLEESYFSFEPSLWPNESAAVRDQTRPRVRPGRHLRLSRHPPGQPGRD